MGLEYGYIEMPYFQASSQRRKTLFHTVKTLCLTPTFFFLSFALFFFAIGAQLPEKFLMTKSTEGVLEIETARIAQIFPSHT